MIYLFMYANIDTHVLIEGSFFNWIHLILAIAKFLFHASYFIYQAHQYLIG